ncbi:lipoprotein signal peptidase [Escherichia coli]|nr:lipoprotein signal peptidase [Escherichia coli]
MSQSICSTGLRWLWLVVVVLIIDLGSKYLILQNFALGDTVPLFPSLNLHYARNYGAAFSFLADSGGWQRWFFAGIAIGISVILAVMMYRSKATQKLNNIAYALIIGGALGNLFDRLWHGFVVDMIDFYVGDWHFATFNLADTAICVGAALIVLEGFLPSKAKKTIINPAGCDADASYPAYRLLRNRRPHPAKILKI